MAEFGVDYSAETEDNRGGGLGTINPTFSVILPTHNRGSMIGRSVASVLNQTRSDFELLIVDDASSDDTERWVMALQDPRVRYIRHDRQLGAGAARNTGIQAATGTYVAFLDSDDEWLPTKLERQLKAIEKSDLTAVGMVTCGETAVKGQSRTVTRVPTRRGWVFEDVLLQRTMGCRTSALFVRRDLLTEHSIAFDPVLPARQDWDFVAKIARVSQIEVVPEPLVIVHNHDGERVWTPDRAVAAGLYLHDRYSSDLEKRSLAHNRFHLRIAVTCMAAGDWVQAREQIREAIKARPGHPISYLWLAVTALGQRGAPSLPQRAAMKILRRLTF